MSLVTRSTVTALELFRERIARTEDRMEDQPQPCDGTRRGCYCARCLARLRRDDEQYEALRQGNFPRSVPWWMYARDT